MNFKRCLRFSKNFQKKLDRIISCVIISMLLYAELVHTRLRGEGMKCPKSELKIMNL